MIAFVTTCKNRTQHLEETLPKNLADNASYADCKFVLVDYNSSDHLLDYLKSNHIKSIESGRLVVYSFRAVGPFRMAHAKNLAHRLGIREGGNILVNLDADNFTGANFAEYVGRMFAPRQDFFLWSRMVKGELRRGISGRIAMTSTAFLLAGGYDEKFATWAPDDKDMNLRLRNLGFKAIEIDPGFLDSVPHNDKMRFKDYKHVQRRFDEPAKRAEYREILGDGYEEQAPDAPLKRYVIESDRTVANYGRVGHAVVYRNFESTPISIGPMPTRIFAIGMHKTATTSLHLALQMLGYRSAHWESAHWAKAVWEEMNEFGKSRTLEKYQAACDLPIPLLYESLDIAYPGSKFILTIRDENKWIASIRKHWDYDQNHFRPQWDHDPFTHRIHRELYGQTELDAELFLARYSRHNSEVMEYFKHRPDLLVMDVDAPNSVKWEMLCGFLHEPVPAMPYPWAMKS